MVPHIRKRPRLSQPASDVISLPTTMGHNSTHNVLMAIEYVSTKCLKRPVRETRKHSKKQVEQIVASMRRFGNMDPLVVDGDNRIFCGVARYLAAQMLGLSAMRGFRHWRWHLDEVYVKINGEMHYLWRAVDHEGEVLESYVTKTRDKKAALAFMKRALKRHGSPERITTDGLGSYKAAMRNLGNAEKQEVGRHANNRVENSHLPFRRRERAMLRFRQMRSLQKFASIHANVHNHFNLERHLVDRTTYKERRSAALAEWQSLAS